MALVWKEAVILSPVVFDIKLNVVTFAVSNDPQTSSKDTRRMSEKAAGNDFTKVEFLFGVHRSHR